MKCPEHTLPGPHLGQWSPPPAQRPWRRLLNRQAGQRCAALAGPSPVHRSRGAHPSRIAAAHLQSMPDSRPSFLLLVHVGRKPTRPAVQRARRSPVWGRAGSKCSCRLARRRAIALLEAGGRLGRCADGSLSPGPSSAAAGRATMSTMADASASRTAARLGLSCNRRYGEEVSAARNAHRGQGRTSAQLYAKRPWPQAPMPHS
jgi:hypothetical protein